MKRVQTVLGDHGLLHERETERAHRLKKKAHAVWADRSRPHFRRWA